jgi:predicted O-methyltransferase YrrM
MNDWSGGYITDIDYIPGAYRELTPSLLTFAALASGVGAPDARDITTYCELGCGQGYSTNILAAANPHIQFHANDFNPSHVLAARALAAAAGTRNVHFSDGSFAEFASEALPAFDVVALHGVYSWVSEENQRQIVDFIRTRLKVGGLVYISYNALPGSAPFESLRRLMASGSGMTSASVGVEQGLAYAQRLFDLNPAYLRAHTGLADYFRELKGKPRGYIAHEYFNRHWKAFYHADIAADLAAAKLTYVASANLLDTLDAAHFTPEHQAFLAATTDPTERETLRDYLLNQRFRRDLFVKGKVPLARDEAGERWLNTRFVLTTPRSDVPLKIMGALGEASLQAEVYVPILDALSEEPRTTRQLLADPKVEAVGSGRVLQALIALVGSSHLQPALDEAGDTERRAHTRAFNLAVLRTARVSDDLRFLASPISGGMVPVDRVTRLFLLALEEGQADVPAFVWGVLNSVGARVAKDNKKLETPEENLAELRVLFETFNSRQLSVFRSVGIA